MLKGGNPINYLADLIKNIFSYQFDKALKKFDENIFEVVNNIVFNKINAIFSEKMSTTII